eukprot:gnl/MRDRNA2_/MRDRNA2_15621_c0_seq1.p1 gnl/MRDRNA2_/MRDRNA2_15621_c0~~gnl/MRDRNA2_/MRDRNA2_15621_c0_seq1.p1  ORF type:complete len:268 (+),score=39.47 gnl/MRDRNA2_/MRDRNA2_15621_c0_seq1:96-806(+)
MLLDNHNVLKIADFGLAKARERRLKIQSDIGTWTHKAPELYSPGKQKIGVAWSNPAEVFSFGIVVSEAITATEAFEIIEETRHPDTFGLSDDGLKSLLDSARHPSVSYHLCDLAVECCVIDPLKRPLVYTVLAKLQALRTDAFTVAEVLKDDRPDYRLEAIKERRAKLMRQLDALNRVDQSEEILASEMSRESSSDVRVRWEKKIERSQILLQQIDEENKKLQKTSYARKCSGYLN